MSRGSVTPYLPCSDPIFAYDTDSVQCPLFGQICISPKTDESVNIALFTSAFPTMVQFIISEHPCTREYPSTAIICRVSPIPLILALSYTRASSITSDCPSVSHRAVHNPCIIQHLGVSEHARLIGHPAFAVLGKAGFILDPPAIVPGVHRHAEESADAPQRHYTVQSMPKNGFSFRHTD